MNIEKVVVGMLETNCYLLEKNNQLLIIDPGEEYNKIKKAIGNRHITGIIITHYHIDHIGALEELKQNDNLEGFRFPIESHNHHYQGGLLEIHYQQTIQSYLCCLYSSD